MTAKGGLGGVRTGIQTPDFNQMLYCLSFLRAYAALNFHTLNPFFFFNFKVTVITDLFHKAIHL